MWRTPIDLAICQAGGSLRADGRPRDRCDRPGGPAGHRCRAHRCAVARGVRQRTGSRRPLIPLGEIVERIDEVPTDGTVYVICGTGPRSAKAVEHYRSLGIDAVNVAGGTRAWIDVGLPIDRTGSEASSG